MSILTISLFGKIEIVLYNPETILHLHALAQGGSSGDTGRWKISQNDIIEIFPDGKRRVRFRPLQPEKVPDAMNRWHDQGRLEIPGKGRDARWRKI